jgi:hypothetical protein
MSIIGIQLLVLMFSSLMLYNVYLYWKKNEIGTKGALVWIVIWGGLLFITLFPKQFEPFAKGMFFVRLFDLATFVALAIISYVMFRNHVRTNGLSKEVETLVRKLAVKEASVKRRR